MIDRIIILFRRSLLSILMWGFLRTDDCNKIEICKIRNIIYTQNSGWTSTITETVKLDRLKIDTFHHKKGLLDGRQSRIDFDASIDKMGKIPDEDPLPELRVPDVQRWLQKGVETDPLLVRELSIQLKFNTIV